MGGATVFVTSMDEWYKAAYYDTGAMSYFDYPAGSDTQTGCTAPGATANTANCNNAVADLTDVGSYTGAASPNGTFDQGGNVTEWNEENFFGSFRGLRGGSFNFSPIILAASYEFPFGDPSLEDERFGFRVASPEPVLPVPSLSPFGMALLSSLLGLASWRRLRA